MIRIRGLGWFHKSLTLIDCRGQSLRSESNGRSWNEAPGQQSCIWRRKPLVPT